MIRFVFLLTALCYCNPAQTNNLPLVAVKEPLPPEGESAYVDQFSFIVYGDTRGRRDGPELQQDHVRVVNAILRSIKTLSVTRFPARFVLHTGDAIVNRREPRQWNQTFIAQINRIRGEAGIPYFLAPGNHDIIAAQALARGGTVEALTNYLKATADLIPPDGAHYRLSGFPSYAFGYGNSFFIALDSNLASNHVQLAWATDQLRTIDRKRYTNVFALLHHPPYSSGPHGGSIIENAAMAVRKNYMPAFREYGVNVVLAGHENFFEHWVERYVDAATNYWRTDLIITGGGGAPPFAFRAQPNLNDYAKADSRYNVAVEQLVQPASKPTGNPFHFIIVRIDGHRVSFEVVGVTDGGQYKPYQTNRMMVE